MAGPRRFEADSTSRRRLKAKLLHRHLGRGGARYGRNLPRSSDGWRCSAAPGNASASAPGGGNLGMRNGTAQLRTSAGSMLNGGNGRAILNAGFGSVRSGYIFVSESRTRQALDLFQERGDWWRFAGG